jgi:hypothetical protein
MLRFQVLMAAIVKVTVCLDIAPFSLAEVYGRLRGAYCLRHQGGKLLASKGYLVHERKRFDPLPRKLQKWTY